MALSQTFNAPEGSQVIVIPPLTAEEEDEIVHTRLINDERPLRRVIKKYHNYASLAAASSPRQSENIPTGNGERTQDAIEEAKEAFLIELASFMLSLKKSAMICEAEARQVQEYRKEKERIENDHGTLKNQIEELKVALEQAQNVRKRKIEYDVIAERVNSLPSREELEKSIQALENDMVAIDSENDTQNRNIQAQKDKLDMIIADLGNLRSMSKEADPTGSPTAAGSPTPDDGLEVVITDELAVTQVEMEVEELGDDVTKSGTKSDAAEEARVAEALATEDNDIEMGEVAEDPKDVKAKKKLREELEEGEASDASSELSDPPDD